MNSILEIMKDIGEPESHPSRQGRFMHLIMARRKDWKPLKSATEEADEVGAAET